MKKFLLNSFLGKTVENYVRGVIKNNFHVFYRHAVLRESSLDAWFFYWLDAQNFGEAKNYSPKNCYYEFGTGWGATLSAFLRTCTYFCKEKNFDIGEIKIFLFDSFRGLPEEAAKEDYHPEWSKGKFAYSKDYIIDIIRKNNFPLENVTFVEGFFEQTLTPNLFQQLKNTPPSIVTMDVDYYSSTKLALNFTGPLLKSGTVFYFDDLYSFFLHPDMGQPKAIKEFNEADFGYLQTLTDRNYAGKCFIYSRKEWEYFGTKASDSQLP